MSGVELVGLAASILQIADLGWKLSYKLYAFSRKIHEAGKNIELISQDISATGAVLKQFADELDKDEKASAGGRLASLELIKAARGIVEECEALFKEIDASVDGGSGNKVILGLKEKLKWSYLEPRIQLLSLNLSRLKASLALMLNVLVYAEQIRGREVMDVLREQKNLIESFAEQKTDTAKKIEQLSKRIEQAPKSVTNTEHLQQLLDEFTSLGAKNIQHQKTTATSTHRDISADSPQDFFQAKAVKTTAAEVSIMLQASEPQSSSTNLSTRGEEPAKSLAEIVDLEHQRKLIEKLLEEVNSSSYAIDHGARYKFHDGVLGLHWQVWAPLRTSHGDDFLRKLLSQSPALARHWHERLLNERRTQLGIACEYSELSVRKDSLGGLGTSTFLEGAPASRASIQRRESEYEAQQRLENTRLAQKIGAVHRPREARQAPSPEPVYSPTTPLGTGKSETTNNPFFKEYDQDYERKGQQIAFAQQQDQLNGGRARDVPGEIRSHISPSNKTAEQALQAEPLKDEQREAMIKRPQLRAEQDALAKSTSEQDALQAKASSQQIQRHINRLTALTQNLQQQGEFIGWHSTVPIEQRAAQVKLLIDSLRLIQPVVTYELAINVALTFEQKAFCQGSTKDQYFATIKEKLSRIQNTRASQVQNQSNNLRQMMQPGQNMTFNPQLFQQMQPSPMMAQSMPLGNSRQKLEEKERLYRRAEPLQMGSQSSMMPSKIDEATLRILTGSSLSLPNMNFDFSLVRATESQGETSTASIADSLILQWTTVSPPPLQ